MTAKREDPAEYLRLLGQAGDGPHDIARAALMLAALDHAGRDLNPKTARVRSRPFLSVVTAMTVTGWRMTTRKTRT